jgi:hypothetical protein
MMTCCICHIEIDWRSSHAVPIWNGWPTLLNGVVDGYMPACIRCHDHWSTWDDNPRGREFRAPVRDHSELAPIAHS